MKAANRQRGVVLVIVLWVITLLTIMAGSFAYSLRIETTLAAHARDQARARAVAEAGVAYAMLQVMNPPPEEEEHWPVDGRVVRWQFGDAALDIRVRDTSGRIDLNRGDRELLKGLFTVVGGLDEQQADQLLDAIEDFRDSDDLTRLNGAEDPEYKAAGRDYGPKNALFESVDELQQVLGVTPGFYQRVAGFLTVYSNQPGINPEMAAPEVLYAVPDVEPLLIDQYLQLREENASLDLPAPPPPDLGPYLSQARGLAYDAGITVNFESGTAAFVEATVTQGRRPEQPYHLLTWREGKSVMQPESEDPQIRTDDPQ